ncbi:ABC transporter substrate-binding protein [Aeromicrobium sp. YIM 150415]|uniref:ABC transporter substrate-binding protein n=1 Tax=Aeromicrobium sp. YIM 150415 TaxID=2803912 RepID=UPI0019625F01|nr:ABC transporter substrate-binding protein [Aeromicrobium sp. YIM 150415]MBM9462836.1 ABC transporter substrate-binding protein [Aeromicrobium sp. YIM 150415]
MLRRTAAIGASTLLAVAGVTACGSDGGGDSTTVKIVAFQAPSLGAFLPAVIEERELDAEHGLDLQFTYATPDNYNSEFGAGHYDVGGSAALLSEGLRTERGADVTYLFNLFDFYGTVVTSDPDIESLTDLPGHTLAAATGTTNYAMFAWFAQDIGLDLNEVETQNQTTAGLSTMAQTGRADATQLWEPAYSSLLASVSDIRTVDLDYDAWESEFGTGDIPYLGVAAQTAWVDEHPDEVQSLYDTYKAAADWVLDNPEEAGALIAKTIPGGDAEVIQKLIEDNDERLRLRVAPASDVTEGIRAVFEAGIQTGYLADQPPDSVIFDGLQ